MGYMASKAVWILNSRTGVEGEDFVGGRNRMSKVLVAWKIWNVYREEQNVKSDGIVIFR